MRHGAQGIPAARSPSGTAITERTIRCTLPATPPHAGASSGKIRPGIPSPVPHPRNTAGRRAAPSPRYGRSPSPGPSPSSSPDQPQLCRINFGRPASFDPISHRPRTGGHPQRIHPVGRSPRRTGHPVRSPAQQAGRPHSVPALRMRHPHRDLGQSAPQLPLRAVHRLPHRLQHLVGVEGVPSSSSRWASRSPSVGENSASSGTRGTPGPYGSGRP